MAPALFGLRSAKASFLTSLLLNTHNDTRHNLVNCVLFLAPMAAPPQVGCGVGNTVFPLLEANPQLRAYACDFSPRAVQVGRARRRRRAAALPD